jgi:antitoxin component YwqK of YwqJK toxin-antitoxin module
MELQHANGEPHGTYRAWWDNGARKQEGQYASGKLVGKLRIYDETGTLIEEDDLDLPSNKSLERTREK